MSMAVTYAQNVTNLLLTLSSLMCTRARETEFYSSTGIARQVRAFCSRGGLVEYIRKSRIPNDGSSFEIDTDPGDELRTV